MDYVAYHGQSVMGSELGDGPPFGMRSRKPVRHLVGNTVWVVEGRGKKKQYFLKQRFHVDTVEEIVDEYFRFQYVGQTGDNFTPEIPLSSESWFKDFLKGVANFSIGVSALRPEFLSRFEGLTNGRTNAIGTNVDPEDWQLTEGEITTALRSFRSRSSTAREACIDGMGSNCFACGFDFGTVYGPECEGYIEVHHRQMIASRNGPFQINPLTDLVPLCPNCHRALHIMGIDVEDFAARMRERKP